MGGFFRFLGWSFHVVSSFILALLVLAWIFALGLSGWWILLGFIPAFVVVYLMIRVRSQHGWKRAIIGALLVGLNSMAIVSALLNEYPDIPDNTDPATLEYSVGSLPLVAGYYNLDSLTTDRYVIFVPQSYQDTVNLEITIDNIETVNGDWVLERGRAIVDCGNLKDCNAPEGTYNALNTSERDWDISVPSNNVLRDAELIIDVDIPIDETHVHQWFELQVIGDFIYPRIESRTHSVRLGRTLSLYVGTEEEFLTRIQYNRWMARNAVLETQGLLIAVVITFIMGIGFAYYGLWVGRAAFTTKRPPIQHLHHMKVRNFDPKRHFDNPPPFGVEVVNLQPDSVWAKAGLLPGDVLVEAYDDIIRNVNDFRKKLKTNPDAKELVFTVWRSGETFQIAVPFNVMAAYGYEKAKRY